MKVMEIIVTRGSICILVLRLSTTSDPLMTAHCEGRPLRNGNQADVAVC